MSPLVTKKSLRLILTRYFYILALVPLCITGLISSILSYDTIKKVILSSNNRELEYITKHISETTEDVRTVIDYFRVLYMDNIPMNPKNFIQANKMLMSGRDYILTIQISTNNGIVNAIYPENNLMLGSDVSSHEYFSNLHNNDRFYWSSSFISEIISTPVIAVSSRLSQDYIITVLVSLDGLSDMITRYTKDSNFKVTVSDKRNVYIVHYDKDKVIQRVYDFNGENKDNQRSLNYLINTKYFMEMNWKITAFINRSEILKPSFIVAFWIISLTVLLMIYISFYTKDINKKLVKDFDSILFSTQNIQKGNYNLTKVNLEFKEFDYFSNSFLTMADTIHAREKELKLHREHLQDLVDQRTAKLNATIDNLTMAQKQLVQSEKMASLGGLVAGISHEINTPIGIILTSATFLKDEIIEIKNKMALSQLTKSEFDKYCISIFEAADLIEANSRRSSELIQSFKLVSADQSGDYIRKILLNEYLWDIIRSLKPQFNHKDVKVEVNCPSDFFIVTYAGSFSQILTNLIINSISHGFEDLNQGEISIEIVPLNDNFILNYKDNGNGMTQEALDKIFEPFYTTKRGRGGTGLGMHITYNIVHQKLGGKISVKSEVGKGVEFIIELPLSI